MTLENSKKENILLTEIQGTSVRLIFLESSNTEVPNFIYSILKNNYIQTQNR